MTTNRGLMLSDALLAQLRDERARLVSERERIDDTVSALDRMLESHIVPKPSRSGIHGCPDCGKTFASANALGPHRRAAHGYRKATTNEKRGPRPQYDWDRGRRLWDQGKTTDEIAAALGCNPKTVKNARSRYNWPARKSGWNKVRSGGKRKKVPMTKCPNCEKLTTLDPCENCHMKIPPAAVGKA